VVSFDWIMSGLRAFPDLWQHVETPVELQRSVGWSLMSRVIEQQLARGASVIADLVARDAVIMQWQGLATRYNASFSVIECTCADIDIHRSRVEGRQRNIPDWYELPWERVARGRELYPLLSAPKLALDAGVPLRANVTAAMEYVESSFTANR
jgi:hypothetical protein